MVWGKGALAKRKAMLEMFKMGYLEGYMSCNKRLKNKKTTWKKIAEQCLESFREAMVKL